MILGTHELFIRYPWMREHHYMALYVLKHGMDDLIQIPFFASNIAEADKIYKRCIEQDKTWREVLNVNKSENAVIL